MAQTSSGEKFVRVRKYTQTVGGAKIKVGAIKGSPRKTAASSESSVAGLARGNGLARTTTLSDALRTPLQSGAVALGWHIIHEGCAWCAIGPVFADLLVSPAGWGATPEEARAALATRHQRNDGAVVPALPEFRVWR
jgi:hypothetical protein